jgi:hypothetical protein
MTAARTNPYHLGGCDGSGPSPAAAGGLIWRDTKKIKNAAMPATAMAIMISIKTSDLLSTTNLNHAGIGIQDAYYFRWFRQVTHRNGSAAAPISGAPEPSILHPIRAHHCKSRKT